MNIIRGAKEPRNLQNHRGDNDSRKLASDGEVLPPEQCALACGSCFRNSLGPSNSR